MIAYKVVREEAEGLSSAFASNCTLEYGIGLLTVPEPRCGPLCVFRDLEAAEDFVGQYWHPDDEDKDMQIWEAECVPSRARSVWEDTYFTKRPGTYDRTYLADLPPGTALVNSVTLLRRVA